jgi:hypothetical protein
MVCVLSTPLGPETNSALSPHHPTPMLSTELPPKHAAAFKGTSGVIGEKIWKDPQGSTHWAQSCSNNPEQYESLDLF